MNVDFYKELHNREQGRRTDIDNAINIPIGLITLIIGLISYFFQEKIEFLKECYAKCFIFLIIISLLISIFYIAKGFNDLLKGYEYAYLPKPIELFNYENEVSIFNSNVDEAEKQNYEAYLKENLARIATINKQINDKRLEYLHYAKKFIIIAFILTIFLIIIFVIKNI